MIKNLGGAAVLALALMAASPARAESFELDYEATFLLLPLGKAKLTGHVAPATYQTEGFLQTTGVAALFDNSRLVAKAKGERTISDLRWREYSLSHTYAKKFRRVALKHGGEAVQVDIQPRFSDMGDPAAAPSQMLESRDPLSSLLALGAHVAQTKSCDGVFKTFDGRHRYDLQMATIGPGKASGAYEGPVLRCTLRYVPVAGYNPAKENERRNIPSGEIWFAQNGSPNFAPPVRLSVRAPVGEVVIKAKRVAKGA